MCNKVCKHNAGNIIAEIDRDLFEKAFFNIISNALKFTEEKGSINIVITKDNFVDKDKNDLIQKEGYFTISVEDTGIGIPENKLQDIFERFGQVDNNSLPYHQGTGIGLSFALEIIKLHTGDIIVKSIEGRGSTFFLSLPYSQTTDKQIVTQFADIKLFTSTQNSAFFQQSMVSWVAQMLLIDIVYAGLAVKEFNTSVDRIQKSAASLSDQHIGNPLLR